jgi:uncharacterized MnhB-related membrane protein
MDQQRYEGSLAPRSSSVETRLSIYDLLPAALGAAALFVGPLVAHASLLVTAAGVLGAAIFLGGSLVVLRVFGRALVPAVLTSAAAGALAGFVYWLLARPDLTAIGTAGLGAIGGAAIAPFELIWLQFREEMAELEAQSQSGFVYTGFFSTLWRTLSTLRRARRELKRGPTPGDDGAA